MKYKLKRDLPLAKAGTKVRKAGGVRCIPIAVWPHGAVVSDEYFDQLISEGWIEPIKPREWWEIMHRNNKVCPPCDNEQMYSNLRFDCYQSAKDFFSSHNIVEGFEIIKVQEVIE